MDDFIQWLMSEKRLPHQTQWASFTRDDAQIDPHAPGDFFPTKWGRRPDKNLDMRGVNGFCPSCGNKMNSRENAAYGRCEDCAIGDGRRVMDSMVRKPSYPMSGEKHRPDWHASVLDKIRNEE